MLGDMFFQEQTYTLEKASEFPEQFLVTEVSAQLERLALLNKNG